MHFTYPLLYHGQHYLAKTPGPLQPPTPLPDAVFCTEMVKKKPSIQDSILAGSEILQEIILISGSRKEVFPGCRTHHSRTKQTPLIGAQFVRVLLLQSVPRLEYPVWIEQFDNIELFEMLLARQ